MGRNKKSGRGKGDAHSSYNRVDKFANAEDRFERLNIEESEESDEDNSNDSSDAEEQEVSFFIMNERVFTFNVYYLQVPKLPCKIAMFDFNQCDPKRCSGRKLQRHGLMTTIKLGSKFPGLILSPTGTSTLSPADRDFILANGLAVVDCSWNQVEGTPLHRVKVNFFKP